VKHERALRRVLEILESEMKSESVGYMGKPSPLRRGPLMMMSYHNLTIAHHCKILLEIYVDWLMDARLLNVATK